MLPAAAARRSPGRRSLVRTAPLHGEFLYAVTPFVASLQVTIFPSFSLSLRVVRSAKPAEVKSASLSPPWRPVARAVAVSPLREPPSPVREEEKLDRSGCSTSAGWRASRSRTARGRGTSPTSSRRRAAAGCPRSCA